MSDFDYVRRVGRHIRVHGNGFIQIDMPGSMGERIHIFGHPSIPRQAAPTPVHDHRFGFTSKILSGCLVNVHWELRAATKTAPATHRICHYETPADGGEDTKLVPSDNGVWLFRTNVAAHTPGCEYTIHPARFHETFANEATVTRMTKTVTIDHRPRVLCRLGQEPDNSFNRYQMASEELLWEIVKDAFRLGGLG